MNINNVKIIDPLNDSRWDSFVNSHPYGTIYHHSSWMNVISLTFKRVKSLCFILEDDKLNIRAAIPCFVVKSKLTGTRIVSLPFSSYCDPLVNDREDFIILLEKIINQLNNISASYYELRCFRNQDLIDNSKLRQHNYHKIHVLDIEDDFEKVNRFFHKSCVVRSVKKAVRCGVTVRQCSSEQDIKKFYLIHSLTRKRLGFPIQPYEFFKNMWKIMWPLGYFNILLAEFNKKTIAAIALFKFKNIVSFEQGASIPKYLSVRPNHLLLWTAIDMACSEGYRYFEFGKTPPEAEGLLTFKKRWGPKMYNLPYYYYPQIKGVMSLMQNDLRHRVLRSLYKHLPISFAKILGRIAYHHLG